MAKTPIRIYEQDLTLIAEIDNYESLIFPRKVYKAGKFTLRLNKLIKYADELTQGRLIMISDNVNKVGFIDDLQYENKGNSETLMITGYELKGIFKHRATIPTAASSHQSFSSEKAETIIKSVVQRNCLDIAGMDYDELSIATDLTRGGTFDFNTRYGILEDELEKFGKLAEMGTQMYIDFTTGKWVFDVLIGVDRTAGTGSTRVIFSNEYNNLETQKYIKSYINSANYAIVAGQGDGAARTIEEVGTASNGLDRRVIFVDARDLNVAAELEARGNEKLAANAPIESFECQILNNGTFPYETAWDLGDFVTIQNDTLGISLDKQIDTVIEYYTDKGFEVEAYFGDELKTITDLINDLSQTANF